ncbi:MAG: hypothetical protein DI637_08570 [Citromicrobium sp.]|nr:MAG: hypothetical protein DI637_08570 [Citromicrobium sp.]
MSENAEPTAEPITELPARGWTPERKMLFLDCLASSGNARAACRRIGLSAESAYRQRRKDALFARAWAAAVVLGRDASQQVLADRAVEGIEEDIWHRGEVVGTRRRYDTRLLLAHLARLDKLASEDATEDAAHFEELLTRIGDGEDEQSSRSRYISRSADQAAEDARRRELTVELDDEDGSPAGSYEVPEREIDSYFGHVADDLRASLAETELEAEERARQTAAETWDRLANVRDAAFDKPDEGRKCESPQDLPDAVKAILLRRTPSDGLPPFAPVPVSNPRTASTVSTCALARTLAGPPSQFRMISRSPFDAPRATRGR